MTKFPRWLFLAGVALARVANAQFIPTAAGPYNYNDPANWIGGSINGVFDQPLVANQTILLPLNLSAAPTFTFGGNFDLTLRGSSPSLSSLHFVNNPLVDSTAGGRTVNIGAPTAQNQVGVILDSPVQFTVADSDTLVLWNRVSGAALGKLGAGTMILRGANTYVGGTGIGGGVLEVSADNNLGAVPAAPTDNLLFSGDPFAPGILRLAASFEINATRSIKILPYGGGIDTNGFDSTFAGSIGGDAGNAFFYKRGAGELRLKGTGTYFGTTFVSGGTLAWDYTADNGSKQDPAGEVSLTGRSTLSLTGSSFAPTVQAIANVTIGGSTELRLTSGSSQSVSLNVGNLVRNGGTLDLTLPGSGGIHVTAPATTGVLGYATVAGVNWAIHDAGGFLVRLPAYDLDSLAVASNSDLTTSQTVPASTAINSLRFHTPSAVSVTLDPAARLTIGASGQTGGILVTANVGNNAVTISGGQLTADTNDLAVIQNNAVQPVTISSAIVNGAAPIGLTKSGPGVLVLSGANTFTRGTFVAEGTLRLSGGGQLPDGRPVSLLENTTLDLGGIPQRIGGLSGDAGSVIALGGATLTLGADNNGGLFGGVIAGPGGLSKTGSGSQRLTSANTYAGPTLIDGGFILLSGNGSLPPTTTLNIVAGIQAGLILSGRSQTVANLASASSGASIFGPGTFTIGAGDGTYAGKFLSALALVKDGAGTTTVLTGQSTHTGGTTLKAGTLAIASDATLGGGSVNIPNLTFDGGVLQLSADFPAINASRSMLIVSDPAVIDTNGFSTAMLGTISGSGGLTKIGAGTLTLGADSSSTNNIAGVTVSGGTLIAASNGVLGVGPVRLNGGTLSATGALNRGVVLGPDGGGLGSGTTTTVLGIVSGTGALTVNTPGTVTLIGQNSYSGGTQIGPSGALLVNFSNRSLGTGPVTVLTGGLLGLESALNLAPGVLVSLRPGAVLALLNNGIDPAAVLDSDPAKTTGGILAIGGGAFRALDMAAIGNGRLFLSAFGSAGYYSFATLGANVDGVYRIGAGTAAGTNVLTFNGFDNVLTGARPLIIGSTDVAGNATIVLLKSNDFTGGTTLAGGTLALGNDHALGSGSLTIAGGSLSAYYGVAIENPILASGDFGIGASASSLNLNGTVDLGGGTRRITFAGTSQSSPVVQINGRIGNGALDIGGAGVLILNAANDYTGGTTVSGGTLRSLVQGTLGSGSVTLGGVLRFENSPQVLSNPIALTGTPSLGFDVTANVTGSISSTGPFAITLFLGGTSPSATISGAISDGARTLALSKSGSGTIALTGTNSYRGGTTFFAGAIAASTDASLGAALNTEGNLIFRGGTLRYDAAFTLNPSRYFEIQQNASTAPTIDTNGFDVTIGNVIRGNATSGIAGRFIKGGAGKLTLTGSNSYSGATLNAGTLQFNSLASMGNGTVTMAAGTVVAAGFPIDQAFLNKLSKSSAAIVALAANSAGPLNFTGANWRLGAAGAFTFTGTLTPNGSTYRLGGGGGTLTLPSSILSGARSLDVAGDGTVVLSNVNTYTGSTNINGGTLKLGSSGALPGTSAIALANSAAFDASSLAVGFTLGTGKSLLGSGRVLGRFTASSGSTVSPGSAAAPFGELSLAEFTLRGRYLADIDALGHHDLLTIAGNLDLSSATDALTVNVIDSLSGEYVLATYSGTLTGVFDSIALPPGTAIDYGTGANSQIRIVPEPGSGVLTLAGALAFARRRARGSANSR